MFRYGTAVEHHSLYQYQFSSSKNVVAGFVQTETPYVVPRLAVVFLYLSLSILSSISTLVNANGSLSLSPSFSFKRYYQPDPNAANSPYPLNATLNDPKYATSCLSGAPCDALGLRILNSQGTFIYGAGLYSFFNNYSTTCSNIGGPENCQSEIFSIDGSVNGIQITDLITVGTKNMIVNNGASVAVYSDNVNVYPDAIAYFTP